MTTQLSPRFRRTVLAAATALVLAPASPVHAQAATADPPAGRERMASHLARAIGPEALAESLLAAALSQIRESPEAWETDAKGFGRRYVSSLGMGAISEGVQFGVESWLHHDTRYRRRGSGRFFGRVGHAAKSVVVAVGRDGRAVPAWSRFAGAGSAAAVSTLWYPEDNGAGRYIVGQGFSMLGGELFANLWDEFGPDVRRKLFRR